MTSAEAAIKESRARIDELSGALLGYLDRLATLVPTSDAACQTITNATMQCAFISAELNNLKATLAGKRLNGERPPPTTKAEELELHASTNSAEDDLRIPDWMKPRPKRVASKPRPLDHQMAAANDHSQDEGPELDLGPLDGTAGEGRDRDVAISGKEAHGA